MALNGKTVVLELAKYRNTTRPIALECSPRSSNIGAGDMDNNPLQQFTLELVTGQSYNLKTHDGYYATIRSASIDEPVFKYHRKEGESAERQQWIFEVCPPSRGGYFIVSASNPEFALDVSHEGDNKHELQMFKKHDHGRRFQYIDNQVFYIHDLTPDMPRVKPMFIMENVGATRKGYRLATRADVEDHWEEVKDAVRVYDDKAIKLKDTSLWPGDRWRWRFQGDRPRGDETYQLLVLQTSDDAGPEFRVIEREGFPELGPNATVATVSDARQYRREVEDITKQEEYYGYLIGLRDGHIFNGRIFTLDDRYTGFKYTLIRFDKYNLGNEFVGELN